MISKDQGYPGCYPRSLAPALFILALGQSLLLNYRTCLLQRLRKEGCQPWHPLPAYPSPPSGLTPGGGKSGRPIAQANIKLELPEFDPRNLPEWAEEFAQFLLLTSQSHLVVATKCSLLKRSCKKKVLQIQVKQIVKTCSTWAEVLQRLEKTFPVYETDLSVRTQIEEVPMLPEFPSAVRVSEYVCDLEYVFSRMNLGPHSAQSQLARARAVGLVTGPHARTPRTHSQWAVGPGRTPERTCGRRWESARPRTPRTKARGTPPGCPRAAPTARQASAQAQLARARTVGLVTGPHTRTHPTGSAQPQAR